MVKIRYQFKRSTPLRFLSHLDQQRLFQRAFRRANLPVEYSQGFNPHPKMSFALAMSVGLTSDCEYGEVIVSEDIDEKTFINRINQALPTGLEVVTARICESGVESLSASLRQSVYRLRISVLPGTELTALTAALESFLALPQILVQKRNKRGKFVEKDIRPFIESITVYDDAEKDKVNLQMTLKYIEQQCVKPEQVLASFNEQHGAVFVIDPTLELHREKLLLKADA